MQLDPQCVVHFALFVGPPSVSELNRILFVPASELPSRDVVSASAITFRPSALLWYPGHQFTGRHGGFSLPLALHDRRRSQGIISYLPYPVQPFLQPFGKGKGRVRLQNTLKTS